ncbi:hypothetical protein [Pseudonocardia sp.]|uniref:hypothetical protein n=1 Tax=Pseudonocardia sp. TaxID=60912 RepID=UPI00262197FF|nr:hypothetical protein [Pseudonocardia sp.]
MGLVLVDLGATPGTAVASVPVQNVEPPPGEGPEFGKASPVALVVILLLGLATVLLIISMTRHLKKVPASFDPEPDAGEVSPEAPERGR